MSERGDARITAVALKRKHSELKSLGILEGVVPIKA